MDIGISLLLVGLLVVSVALTAIGYAIRKGILAAMGSLFWLLSGFMSFIQSTKNWSAWDIYLGLAFGCLFFGLVTLFGMLSLREQKEDLAQMVEDDTTRFNREFAEMGMSLHAIGGYPQPKRKPKEDPTALTKYITNQKINGRGW